MTANNQKTVSIPLPNTLRQRTTPSRAEGGQTPPLRGAKGTDTFTKKQPRFEAPCAQRANRCVTPCYTRGVPTKYTRLSLTRDPVLDEKIASLRGYGAVHGLTRDMDLVRAMIDAGYHELRQRELEESIAANMGEPNSPGRMATRRAARRGAFD